LHIDCVGWEVWFGLVVVDVLEDLDGFGIALVARVEDAAPEGVRENCS
jgi:hypothetical protein